jgi:DNA-binding NtrC family response regulator/pSer/pThr/pTyr-binding forkhead associated (FHA) protein
MPSLVAATGPLAGSRFMVDGDTTIGRSPSCEIAIADSRASRRHVQLSLRDGKLTLTDLGSRNGTLVNGERITGSRTLEPGDRVIVGSTTFVVDPPLAAEVQDSNQSRPDELLGVEDVLPVAGTEGVLLSTAGLLFSAESLGAVVRRTGEELMRALGADVVAALVLQDGTLLPTLILGGKEVAVPRPLVRAALDERSVARLGTGAAAPLSLAGTESMGILFVERADEPLNREELGLLTSVARLAAGAIVARKQQTEAGEPDELLLGQSRLFRRSLELARKMAFSDLSACFVGERGTGKRLLARFAVARGPRALQPVVTVDCRAGTAEAHLFGGHSRASAFARADGGTLLLVGLDALPRALLPRLLDCLQRGRAPGPDGNEIRFDLRVLTTSRESPSKLAARGDLPFELATLCAGVEVDTPPLRERPGDVAVLMEHISRKLFEQGLGQVPPLADDARALIHGYAYPGNIRELENLVARLAGLQVARVEAGHLPPELRSALEDADVPLATLVGQVERDAIRRAMAKASGKKVEAARLLGISRPTLDKKLAEFGLGGTRRRGDIEEGTTDPEGKGALGVRLPEDDG